MSKPIWKQGKRMHDFPEWKDVLMEEYKPIC